MINQKKSLNKNVKKKKKVLLCVLLSFMCKECQKKKKTFCMLGK